MAMLKRSPLGACPRLIQRMAEFVYRDTEVFGLNRVHYQEIIQLLQGMGMDKVVEIVGVFGGGYVLGLHGLFANTGCDCFLAGRHWQTSALAYSTQHWPCSWHR